MNYHPFLSRFHIRAALFSLLLLVAASSQQACLPGPVSVQIETVLNCSDRANPVTSGSFDVSLIDTYFMRLVLINNLALIGNPSTFIPETNFVDLKEAKAWFEYPANFSRISMGSALLHTQENPLIIPIIATLRPTLTADFIGLGGATGGGAPQGEPVPFHLVPTTLSRIWSGATELEAKALTNQDATRQSGASFTVIAHVTVSGITRSGQLVATPEFRFPIRVCKGCLDAAGKKGKPSLCLGAPGGTFDCIGQDGNCTTSTP